MNETSFFERVVSVDPPTSALLPNIPLSYGKKRNLSALAPIYVDPSGFDPERLPSKIYFVHLAEAIQLSQFKWLENALKQKNLPLKDETSGINVLHIAAKSGSETILTMLLKNYEVLQLLNESDYRGITPLIVAAWYGNFAALKNFLALGCETTAFIYDSKKTALHCAADLSDSQLCSQLLKYNDKESFIDAVDARGNTALMIAVRAGSPCVAALLMAGADHMYKNDVTGRNILHIAVVFFQHDILVKLIRAFNDVEFISAVDFNGDNPFMLAIRLFNFAAINFLIQNIPMKILFTNCSNCPHFLVRNNLIETFKKIMSTATDVDFLEWTDFKGRTPLMCAIETQNLDFVTEILKHHKHLRFQNPLNDETVLHVAANANNDKIMRLLLNFHGVEEIIDEVDIQGKTAYEVVLNTADQSCYYALKEAGFVASNFLNSNKETALFIAAKVGNYDLMLNLLLSRNFVSFHKEYPKFTKLELVRAELQGRIYSSDCFIICGETLNLHAWNRAPDQKHLFRHNAENKNIFHACVMGEKMMCLAFLYTYCAHFNDCWKELDLPDVDGTTPLLLATKTGQRSMCKFLVQNGANIAYVNLAGEDPLMEMADHVPYYSEMLTKIINECVVEDTSKERIGISSGKITVFYHVFCPTATKQTTVIRKILEAFSKSEVNFDILQNPVVEYFIETKWAKLKNLIRIRFYLTSTTALYTYTFVSLSFWEYPPLIKVMPILRLISLILSAVSILINTPLVFDHGIPFVRRAFSQCLFVSPLSSMTFLFTEPNTRLNSYVGSLAVFSAGLSMFTYTQNTSLGKQIAVFYKVLTSIIANIPMCLILILSFSFCFFVLFHDHFNFNNPLISFIYTVVVLSEGETVSFPTFQREHYLNNGRKTNYTNGKAYTEKTGLQTTMYEGTLLILFKLLVSLSLMNMLIGLSVRSASELEKGGMVQTLKTKADVLNKWEMFSVSKFYQFIARNKLHLLFGLHSNLRELLQVPLVVYPFEKPLKNFQLDRLQNIAIKKRDIKSIELKFLSESIGYQESSHS